MKMAYRDFLKGETCKERFTVGAVTWVWRARSVRSCGDRAGSRQMRSERLDQHIANLFLTDTVFLSWLSKYYSKIFLFVCATMCLFMFFIKILNREKWSKMYIWKILKEKRKIFLKFPLLREMTNLEPALWSHVWVVESTRTPWLDIMYDQVLRN